MNAVEFTANGKYARRVDDNDKLTNMLYDYDSYLQAIDNPKVTVD